MTPQQTIGHYQVLEQIGEGGIGVVFRGRDLNLDRTVALKLLRADRITPGGHQRFAQEARAASSLNHPNIVQVYDAGSEDGVDYIVMEFVEGRPLDQLIARPLGIPTALRYAVQIAGALAKAHAAGIVHRDLKPSNILIAEDGTAKILDFGLAKVLQSAPGDLLATKTLLHEPLHTEQGTIMGTVAYMAPEQAEGGVVDARADIFAFGAVLFEMITGRRAFEGNSKVSTLAAVLTHEPEPIGKYVTAPSELERIVARCLRKNRERRYQSIADVGIALEDVSAETPPPAAARPRRRFLIPVLSATVAAAIATIVARAYWRSPVAPSTAILTRVTSDAGLTTEPALSTDGKLIAYASDRSGGTGLDIWVQQLPSGQAIRLTNDPADDHQAEFSPDGTTIAFRSEREGGGIYMVSALGGAPRLIVPNARSAKFSRTGDRLAYWTGSLGTAFASQGWILPLRGGDPQQIQPEFWRVQNPIWSPDGKHMIFQGAKTIGDRVEYWIWSEGSAPSRLDVTQLVQQQRVLPLRLHSWTALDRLVFSGGSYGTVNIWTVGIDSSRRRITGLAERLTTGTELEEWVSAPGSDLLALAAGSTVSEVWSLSLKSPTEADEGLARLTEGGVLNNQSSASADGRLVAYVSLIGDGRRVWIRDLRGGAAHRLTAGRSAEAWPQVSPDGSRVAFIRGTSAPPRAQMLLADVRTGIAEVICADCNRVYSWAPNGRKVTIPTGQAPNEGIAEFDIQTKQQTVLVAAAGGDYASPRYSHDGNWISFLERTNNSRTRQLWVAPLTGNERPVPMDRWVRVSGGNSIDREPTWSEDDSAIYFVSNRDGSHCLWVQALHPKTKQPIGEPKPVRHFHSAALGFQAEDSGTFGLAIGGGRMVMSLNASTGNVWLLKRP